MTIRACLISAVILAAILGFTMALYACSVPS
jgi:hypothetical protein